MTAQRWSDSRPSGAGWCQAGMHASPGTERQHRGCGVTNTGHWDMGSWGRAALATGQPAGDRESRTGQIHPHPFSSE